MSGSHWREKSQKFPRQSLARPPSHLAKSRQMESWVKNAGPYPESPGPPEQQNLRISNWIRRCEVVGYKAFFSFKPNCHVPNCLVLSQTKRDRVLKQPPLTIHSGAYAG